MLRNPLIVALDVDEATEALNLARQLKDVAGAFKIGPRLVLRHGPGFVQELVKLGPVFLDHKFYDIPSTMEAALRAVFDLGVTLTTIHASCGVDTLKHLAKVEKELSAKRPFRLLAVTVLTSVPAKSAEEQEAVRDLVKSLAKDVSSSGLTGLVCSPHEISSLKNEKLYLVIPGIRSATDPKGDQQRTMSAGEAKKAGASAIVVGRPILQNPNPVEYARQLLAEMA